MLQKEPIYQQLNQLLKELIEEEGFRVGDRFPTERAICERYEVSRATANKAISNLVSEGILQFKKGVGTFVKSIPESEVTPVAGFTENVRRSGRRPSTRLLHFSCIEAGDAEEGVAALLGVNDSEELYKIERLRLADGIPMILEYRYICARYCPNLDPATLTGSLYAGFKSLYGLEITGSDETIQATIIEERESALLDIEPGQAGFRVSAVGYIQESVPLWWEQTIHRPDGIEFRCRVRPHPHRRNLEERLLLTDLNES